MTIKSFYFIFLLILVGCTQNKPLQHTRWSGEGSRPSLAHIDKKNIVDVSAAGENVAISQQVVENFSVYGSYIKTISQKNKVVFESSATADSPSLWHLRQAKSLQSNISKYWSQFLQNYPEYKNWIIEDAVSVVFYPPELKPIFNVVLREPRTALMHRFLFTAQAQIVQTEEVGSHYADLKEVMALAYPQGPVKSELSQVKLLRDLAIDGLKNIKVNIDTESPAKIKKDQALELLPSDERFDQIQAFYFANKILMWFSEKLGVDITSSLNIVTQVGYPEKTNAAFYYNQKIRLGTGDDIVFSKIYLDPSIVMHETSHFVIDQLARLPFTGEGGSINEGFADVFTTIFLNSPRLGEVTYKKAPFVRTVENKITLKEKTGGLYHDSAIVSGFFWSLRPLIGDEATLQLAIRMLNRLNGYSDFADFTLNLKQLVDELNPAQKEKALQLMSERGLL